MVRHTHTSYAQTLRPASPLLGHPESRGFRMPIWSSNGSWLGICSLHCVCSLCEASSLAQLVSLLLCTWSQALQLDFFRSQRARASPELAAILVPGGVPKRGAWPVQQLLVSLVSTHGHPVLVSSLFSWPGPQPCV